eukprot:11578765-Heterocapsa_arctica.AAC.1
MPPAASTIVVRPEHSSLRTLRRRSERSPAQVFRAAAGSSIYLCNGEQLPMRSVSENCPLTLRQK